MPHLQTSPQTPNGYINSSIPPLHSIECATLDDIESLSVDDIENYVNLLRQHEQHEHYLQDMIDDGDVF